jgi:hypothetical protein
MKRWLIILTTSVIFLFLVARLVIKGYSDGEDERRWYIQQLGFEFSGRVDTVIMKTKYQGLIVFHVTDGNVDKAREDRLNEQLVHNHRIRFLTFRQKDQIQFSSKIAYQYLPGDSVCVNTQQNQVVMYRKGKRISGYPVMES